MKNIIDAILAVVTLLIPRLKKPNSSHGIEETKQAVTAVNEIALLMLKHFHDGIQAADFSVMYDEIIKDPEFTAKMLKAYQDYQQIPEEIADIDVGEGLELVKIQTEYLPKYLEQFQKA